MLNPQIVADTLTLPKTVHMLLHLQATREQPECLARERMVGVLACALVNHHEFEPLGAERSAELVVEQLLDAGSDTADMYAPTRWLALALAQGL